MLDPAPCPFSGSSYDILYSALLLNVLVPFCSRIVFPTVDLRVHISNVFNDCFIFLVSALVEIAWVSTGRSQVLYIPVFVSIFRNVAIGFRFTFG